jgi:hypothetical protein
LQKCVSKPLQCDIRGVESKRIKFFVFEGDAMNPEIIKAIEAILKRGNDVEIRRKGGGYIVLEVKKTIKYSPPA